MFDGYDKLQVIVFGKKYESNDNAAEYLEFKILELRHILLMQTTLLASWSKFLSTRHVVS